MTHEILQVPHTFPNRMIFGTVPVMSTTVEGSAILRPASTMKSSP